MMKMIHLIQPKFARLILASSILGALTFSACQRKSVTEDLVLSVTPAEPSTLTATLETDRLGTAIDEFAKNPTAENHASVTLAFAKLDSEIDELYDRVMKIGGTDRAETAAKLDNLKTYRAEESLRFAKSQAGTAYDATPSPDSHSAAERLEDTSEKVGDNIERSAKNVGRSIENAAKEISEAVKNATR